MPVPRNSNIIAGLAFAASAESVAAHMVRDQMFVLIFKPLAAILLLALPVYSWSRTKQPIALWISIGLFFSLIGDILLLWPDKLFLPGLAAFLITHIAYLVAFTRDAKFPAHWLTLILFLQLAAVDCFALHSHLPAGFAFPVVIYSLALSTMTAQALGRFLLLRASAAKLAAIGAVCFLLSDTFLALDRFQTSLPLAPILILVPYYAAQLLIAFSTRPAGA